MITWLIAAALAASPVTDEVVYTVVDTLYGKPVPKEGVCIQRPTLAEPFKQDVVVIGVMRGSIGCQTLGAMWDGSYASKADGLKKGIDPKTWASASQKERGEWSMIYTTNVVLAFEQFDIADPRPRHSAMAGGSLVQATYWTRTRDAWVAKHATSTYEFDRTGALIREDISESTRWKSSFSVQSFRGGSVPDEPIHTALEQQGRTLLKCVGAAWKEDLTITGRTRMQWTLEQGKATQIALVAQDDDGSGIEQCYYRALAEIEFPPELAGRVIWAFNIDRRPLED